MHEKYKDCFDVTVETFELTADKWIKKAQRSTEESNCGFCRAANTQSKSCSYCPAERADICGTDTSSYSKYYDALDLADYDLAEQYALELLDRLYSLAAEMGILEQLRSEGWE